MPARVEGQFGGSSEAPRRRVLGGSPGGRLEIARAADCVRRDGKRAAAAWKQASLNRGRAMRRLHRRARPLMDRPRKLRGPRPAPFSVFRACVWRMCARPFASGGDGKYAASLAGAFKSHRFLESPARVAQVGRTRCCPLTSAQRVAAAHSNRQRVSTLNAPVAVQSSKSRAFPPGSWLGLAAS